ncbi:MAG: hypothetical protein ACOXZ2_04580 [Sphaerochaetaceae bacterium]|nr:hypothetical protein [Spirochaetales bacterium]
METSSLQDTTKSNKLFTLLATLSGLTWELPQNVLGALVLLYMVTLKKVTKITIEQRRLFIVAPIGVSLGWFIFYTGREQNRNHEAGHSLQSRMVGPLYLLVIGLPSFSRACYALLFNKIKKERWGKYYAGYPERWAEKLGGHFSRGEQHSPQC